MKPEYLAIIGFILSLLILFLGFEFSLDIPGVWIILIALYYLLFIIPKSKPFGLGHLMLILGLSLAFVGGIYLVLSTSFSRSPVTPLLGLGTMFCVFGDSYNNKKKAAKKDQDK